MDKVGTAQTTMIAQSLVEYLLHIAPINKSSIQDPLKNDEDKDEILDEGRKYLFVIGLCAVIESMMQQSLHAKASRSVDTNPVPKGSGFDSYFKKFQEEAFGIDLNESGVIKKIKNLFEIRNAIAHGNEDSLNLILTDKGTVATKNGAMKLAPKDEAANIRKALIEDSISNNYFIYESLEGAKDFLSFLEDKIQSEDDGVVVPGLSPILTDIEHYLNEIS